MYLQKVISRKTYKKIVFAGVLKVKNENSRILILIHWSEARIRIFIKMSRIHNTASFCIYFYAIGTYLSTFIFRKEMETVKD